MSLTSMLINFIFNKGDRKRDKGLTSPADVIRYDNQSYGPCKKWNLLDVYRPKAVKGNLPVIVIVHGGGWVYGTKEVYQFYGMSLAQRGFAVVNFNYRLAPKDKYPSGFEDTNNVIKWMFDNQKEFGFNMNNVFLFGDSAGAHMAAIYSCICTNKSYSSNYSFDVPNSFVPRALALNCGSYNIQESKTNKGMTSKIMVDFLGKSDFDRKVDLISPLLHMNTDFPKTFLMSATGDFLLKDIPVMEEKLKELDIEYMVKVYGDDANKPHHVFHCNIRDDYANRCNDYQCAQMKAWKIQ